MGNSGPPGFSAGRSLRASGLQLVGRNLQRWLRHHLYRWSGPRFGLRDALAWFDAVDVWHRYAAVRRILEEGLSRGSRILEIGPGWFGLEFFLPREFDEAGLLVQVDVVSRPFRRVRRCVRLLHASGWALPFEDRTFDYVVAMDVLEHIPKARRRTFSAELTRVARGSVLLHVPLESGDDSFEAASCDRFLRDWMVANRRKPDRFIEEHFIHGHPSPEEIKGYLPGASLAATQSVRNWKSYMVQERVPGTNLLTGVRSYLRGAAQGPPYYSGLFIWTRENSV